MGYAETKYALNFLYLKAHYLEKAEIIAFRLENLKKRFKTCTVSMSHS